MQVNITPTKLVCRVKAPAHKSWIIRYMIIAKMKGESCTIRNINLCDDVLACIDALDNLGGLMNCGESATVLRLLIPSVIKKYGYGDFICEGNLINRPLDIYGDIFDIEKNGNILHVEGNLKESYSFDSNISSQFVSGLLIAGCEVYGKCVSSPYVEMTRKVLSSSVPFDVTVPEDETLKAYWNIDKIKFENADNNPDMVPLYALKASVSDGTTIIDNLSRLKYKESDRTKNICEILCKLGADIILEDDKYLINGKKSLLGGVTIDPMGDHRLAMMASVASQFCKDKITVLNAECVSKSYPNFYDHFEKCGGIIDVIP